MNLAPPACTSQMLGSQACATTPGSYDTEDQTQGGLQSHIWESNSQWDAILKKMTTD